MSQLKIALFARRVESKITPRYYYLWSTSIFGFRLGAEYRGAWGKTSSEYFSLTSRPFLAEKHPQIPILNDPCQVVFPFVFGCE